MYITEEFITKGLSGNRKPEQSHKKIGLQKMKKKILVEYPPFME